MGRKNENRVGEKNVQVLTLKGRLDSREGDLIFSLHKLETKGNYAWNMVSFLCNLETKR